MKTFFMLLVIFAVLAGGFFAYIRTNSIIMNRVAATNINRGLRALSRASNCLTRFAASIAGRI
ncbi:MAG: hypothetical protein RBS57_08500 [Desulforhabdus sp.]|jgi:hypothetical protein|nr:hypothetical protein [Desulforhabdus sp.]